MYMYKYLEYFVELKFETIWLRERQKLIFVFCLFGK